MKPLHFILKSFIAVLFILIIFSVGIAWKTQKMADDLWSRLGISEIDANRNISNSFLYGNFQYYGAKQAKNVALGDRVAVVNQLVDYAKKYYRSAEFKKAYTAYRDRAKPQEPMTITVNAESIRAEEKERLEKALKIAEEGLNSPNPKIKNGAPARIEHIKKELANIDDPNNAIVKRRLADAERSNQAGIKQYEQALIKYEEKYPSDPNVLMKQRLQKLLDITADVDYAAELREEKGKKYFVKPEYEKKSAEWKLAFRAGKSATDAVRAAAEKWMKEM